MLYGIKRVFSEDSQGGGSGGAGASKTDEGSTVNADVAKLLEKVEALESNSKKLVEEKRALEGKLKSIDDAEKIKKGELEELVKSKETELTTLKGEVDTYKTKAEEAEAFINAEKEDLLSQLPTDELKEIGKDLSLAKLKILVKANVKTATKTDNGNGATDDVKLSDEDKKEAARMGLSEEDYLYVKSKREKK